MIDLNKDDFASMRDLVGYVICRKTNVIVGAAILYKETEKTYKFIWGFRTMPTGLVPAYLNKRKDSYMFCNTIKDVHDYYTKLANNELKWGGEDNTHIKNQLLTLI